MIHINFIAVYNYRDTYQTTLVWMLTPLQQTQVMR